MAKPRRRVVSKRIRAQDASADIAAPSPGIVGFVDAASMRRLGDFVELILYERSRGQVAVPVARLMITQGDFVSRFWEAAAEFYSTLEIFDSFNPVESLVSEATLTLDSPHAIVCNFFSWSRVGMEGMLDCSYVTARSVLRARQGEGDVEVIPVASFQMPTRLQQHLLRRAKALSESIGPELRAAPPGVL